jgi:hypothetical protein
MAKEGVKSAVTKELRDFVLVKTGTAKVKVSKVENGVRKSVEITRPILFWVRENTQQKLNFPLATEADMQQAGSTADGTRNFYGTIHGKTVIVPNPTAGAKPATFSFQVPCWANKTALTKGFAAAGAKVKQFRFAGGRRQWAGKGAA